MPEIAFLNGRFMPLEEAVVSIEDRGFQFADGVYEVIATYEARPFALEEHFQRLERSLQALGIELDIRAYGLENIVEQGIQRSGYAESLIYIQVTRGVAPRRHEFPDEPVAPTVVMTVKEMHRPPANLYEQGVRVVTGPDLRWKRCDIKSISLLANILSTQQAKDAGAFEMLLVDEQGRVTEGSHTSSFRVRDGVLWTTPPGPHILPGITRSLLLEQARDLRIEVREEFSSLDEYLEADEVFIAGTSLEALAVVQIDQATIGTGAPGPVTNRLRQTFLERVAAGGAQH